MNKLFSFFVFSMITFPGYSQPKMQATIKQGSVPLSVDVYVKPSQTFSNKDENIIIVLGVPANIKPAPSLGHTAALPNSLGLVAGMMGLQPAFLFNNLGTGIREIDVTRQVINNEPYYLYTIVFGGTAETDHDWEKGVEQKVCGIQFTGCNSNCNPDAVLLVNLPNGGTRHNSYWYFQANTIADITNYREPFYATDQTATVVNGGSSDGSALSYVSLRLAPAQTPPPFLKATAEACNVNVSWDAAGQTTAAYYTVERSDNNVDYRQIYKVAASNNTTPVAYNMVDKTVFGGKSYYRLGIADVNGKITYGSEREVEISCPERGIAIVTPTLGNGIVNVQLAGGFEKAEVRAISAFGSVVVTDKSQSTTRKLNLTNSGKGAYIIQVLKDGKLLHNAKVIVM